MREQDTAKTDELLIEAEVIAALLARTDIPDAVRENATRELESILAQLKQIEGGQ